MNDEQAAAHLIPMIFGYTISQMVSAAARVGVADAIGDTAKTPANLAPETGTDEAALRRILRALAALGIVAETSDDTFELTPAGHYLRADVENSLRGLALVPGDKAIWNAWGATEDTVRTGKTGFDQVHGMNLFEYLDRNPETADVFHQTMATNTRKYAPVIASNYDFTRFKHIMDVGGGDGSLLSEILRANEGPEGTVFDVEIAVSNAPGVLAAASVADRCTTATGDFFDSVPSGADAYLLKNTLNDWNDEQCRTILGNCRRAMPADGTVLIIAPIMPENSGTPEAMIPALADIEMLVTTGGRERTVEDYRALFSAVGLELSAVSPIPDYHGFSVVEAVPA